MTGRINGKAVSECEDLESLIRSFSFTDDSVTLTDKYAYSGDGEITERLVSLIKPTYENGVLKVVIPRELKNLPGTRSVKVACGK